MKTLCESDSEMIAVPAPADRSLFPFGYVMGLWFAEEGLRRWYWCANGHVSSAIGDIDNHALREWVCRSLNEAVRRGMSQPDRYPAFPATT